MDVEQQKIERSPMLDRSIQDVSITSEEHLLYNVDLNQQWKFTPGTFFSKFYPLLIHMLILCIYTALIFSINERPIKLRFKSELNEAESHIRYEERIFNVLSVARPQKGRIPSPFEGRPTPENNERWKNLTDLMLYGATKEEAAQLSTPTVQAYDDNTVYPVIISVYHHLHDRLRRQAWGDTNPNDESEKFRLMHTDHCVENLRQALLCHGDTTPVPLFYTTFDENGVPENYDAAWEVPHTCRNEQKLQSWAEKGHEIFKTGRLPHFIPVAGDD
ncbi:hypothetical protein GLAREA_02404 [Glarea lozoyensis ATCC 20868]|uniref:Cyclochlorotine biosynthesis protein O n=1 Tax=Glarea lozoyensis (strain ATCC 20868 / MF5171) TaxID=1116229 RepID=S3D342_GLAL2|nr:uncharacterized protein GLAREA_02404 [Glarea lozoyensis ATCC 20868]EPE26491.1 hypothetical protein GLAREA_02404 [Glarea lozoyensis ATCC 20868]